MNQFSYVTALHGNEPLPVMALARIGRTQFVANEKALINNVRFMEKDMNASFGTEGRTLEERAAKNLLAALSPKKQVIDFHTFSCQSPPFAIVVSLDQVKLASTTGLKHVVYMKHNVKEGHALINYRSGISVECGIHNDPETFVTTLEVVKALEKGKPKKISLYEVYGKIEKPGEYHNFQTYRHRDEEFIPVLAGEEAYDFYGLKAKKIK